MSYKFAGRGLETEKPVRIEILDPATNAPLKCTINGTEHTAYLEIFSGDSSRAKRFQADAFARRQRKIGAKRPMTFEELETEQVDYYAALTVGWCIITPDHDLIDEKCTPEAARAFYADPSWAFYRAAADAAIGDRANFTRSSPPA